MQHEILLTPQQAETIARLICVDSFTLSNIKAEDITGAWLLYDSYYFYYKENGVEIAYPMTVNRFKQLAYDNREEVTRLDYATAEEAEVLSQYAGFWIKSDDILEKTYIGYGKIQYMVSLFYSDKPMKVVVTEKYMKEELERVNLIDREEILNRMIEEIA